MSADRTAILRQRFRTLHERDCFVMPNPWDIGSARYLQHLGFPALATTSAGFAFSQGLPDSEDAMSRDGMLAHIAQMVESVDLPMNADFSGGYGVEPDAVADGVSLCIGTGVAGLSIEDSTGDRDHPLHEFAYAVERIRAARAAIDASETGVLLTARAECYLVGHPNAFRESMRRLQAYAQAGADVLYAPGPYLPDEIKALVEAVSPRPFNLLVGRNIGLTVPAIAALGVRRISVGGALARAAWTAFMRAAERLKVDGNFSGLQDLVSHAEINTLFLNELQARSS